MTATPIGPGTKVSLTFTLRLAEGDVVDSTGDAAAEFEYGDGNLLPGFEAAMLGLTEGAQQACRSHQSRALVWLIQKISMFLRNQILQENSCWNPGLLYRLWINSSKASCQALLNKCLKMP